MAARYAFVPFAFSNAIPRVSASLSFPLLSSSALLCSPPLCHSTSRRNDAIALLRTLPLPRD